MGSLQPVRPVTVFQAVFDQLSAMLSSDAYAPGQRVPSERELAEQLHVSRPSVREAMKALRALGLVEVRGRSTYVKGIRPTPETPSLTLPLEDVARRDIAEFRAAIESHIAALAAARATPAGVDALERALAVMQQEIGHDPPSFWAGERRFRHALAEAAENRLFLAAHLLVEEHEQANVPPRPEEGEDAATGEQERVLATHSGILAAVRRRDSTAACRLMQASVSGE